MATQTLNQVRDKLRNLALSHKQIRWFYYGDPWEFLQQEKTVDYAACFLESQPGVIDRETKQQRFNFRVYFLDLVKVIQDTEGNETEVLSDMSSVACDYLAMLMAPANFNYWEVVKSSSITQVTEFDGDMLAGVYVDIGILVEFAADLCQVPMEDAPPVSTFNGARPRILPYDGTGIEGDSFSVSGLAGKIVIAAFRSGFYQRVGLGVPTVANKIGIAGTDLGSRKGILVSTGVVSLPVGDALTSGETLDFLIYE